MTVKPFPDAELDRLVYAAEARFAAAIRKAFAAATERLFRTAKAMTAAGVEEWVSVDDAGVATQIWQQEIPELSATVQAVYTQSGESVAATLVSRAGMSVVPPGAFDVLNQHAADHLAQTRNRLVRFGDAAWGDIRAQLLEGFKAGEGIEPMSRRLRGVSEMSQRRARTVARTEVISASNTGAMTGAMSLPEDVRPATKTWLATRDGRTRPDHVAANRQTVAFTDKFTVGGWRMGFPGEWGAPASEVVNCRCTILFDSQPLPGTEVTRTRASAVADRRASYGDKWNVSPAQVQASEADAKNLRARIRAEAADVQADSLGWMERADAFKIRRAPPRAGRGGEYDWYGGLHPDERNRLRRFESNNPFDAPDVVLARAQAAGVIADTASVDEFMEQWLYHSRRIDAAGALRAGRMPAPNRFAGMDPSDLIAGLADDGLDVARIIGVELEDAAAYVARHNLDQVADEAYSALGPATGAELPPWRMSFQSWEAEVRDLEEIIRDGTLTSAQRLRYDQLVPPVIDSGQDFEVLYAEIVETAKVADVNVAEWAVIPW